MDIYYKYITYENVEKTWNIVRKTCKNKKAIFNYHLNKNTMNYNLYQILLNDLYKPFPFRLFLIYEPKPRLVMSQTVGDKIVNHFVAKFYLLPHLEKKLIDSNVATRKGKGSKYAEKLLQDYINKIRIKNKNQEIFVLKIDISKYFYNIPHDILLSKLEKDLKDDNVLNIIKKIIDETNKPYINITIDKLNSLQGTSIPNYNKDIGLSIGAMTSQFFAIYYLNDLDHYIKEKLKCKYYVRYMDDFVILDTNRNRLKDVFHLISIELDKLKLSVNPKSSITSLNTGITFLGYKYKIINGKFKILYRKKTIRKINNKLKYLYHHDLIGFYKTYASYYGYLRKIKACERKFKMKAIEKYENFKKENPNRIVMVKEGSFYKTYQSDAKILWYLFQYKWNNESIAFGTSTGSKVFDKLISLGIGYVTVESDMKLVKIDGDNKVYNLYSELAVINYDKQTRKKELHDMLDMIIEKDIKNYELIKNYFCDIMK